MKYQVKDFLTLRMQILKNSVLNTLLIAYLSASKDSVFIGKSLIRLEGKLREQVKNSNPASKKIPTFIMADIFVSLNTIPATIQYSYQDFTPITTNPPPSSRKYNKGLLNQNVVSYLKSLSNDICSLYSLNASKADKIFSKLPKSLAILLEHNNISSNYWKTGFSKKIKEVSIDSIDEEELAKYYEALYNRLFAWRMFNFILIRLICENSFQFNNSKKEKVVATHLSDNQLLLYCHSPVTNDFFSYIIGYNELSPTNWKYSYKFLSILSQT